MTEHQPSKVSGNMESTKGAVKENIGHLFGNKSMEMEGKSDRAHGDAEVAAAKAQGMAKGAMDQMSGSIKNTAGKLFGNEKMRAEGEAERLKGKAQKEVNKQ